MGHTGIDDPDAVVLTGYNAGGWGASLLADDVFSNYFPNAHIKTVLIDSSPALFGEWENAVKSVWKAPEHITERVVYDDIMLDTLTTLYKR